MEDIYAKVCELHNAGLSLIPTGGGEDGKKALVPWSYFFY